MQKMKITTAKTRTVKEGLGIEKAELQSFYRVKIRKQKAKQSNQPR